MDETDSIHKKVNPVTDKELEAIQSLQLICQEVGEALERYASGKLHETHIVLGRSLDRICDGMIAYNCNSEPGKYFDMMFNSVSFFQTELAMRMGDSHTFGDPSRTPPWVEFQRNEVMKYLNRTNPSAKE